MSIKKFSKILSVTSGSQTLCDTYRHMTDCFTSQNKWKSQSLFSSFWEQFFFSKMTAELSFFKHTEYFETNGNRSK